MSTNIDERVAREAQAYDEGDVYEHSFRLQSRFWHVFACPNTHYLQHYMRQQVAHHASGSVVLDYGCLTGEFSQELARHQPQQLVGIDISSVGIATARERYGHLADFHVMDAHRTDFADNTFDLIVGQSILHHLDWTTAIQELQRILKPGGKAIFTEPLGDNPGAKLLRRLTPQARTPDEKPVTRSQIQWADRTIGNEHHRFGNLVSVPVAMLTSLLSDNPNNWLLRATDRIDRYLATTSMRYWMRTVILVWEKSDLEER